MAVATGSIAYLGAARFQGFWNASTNEATGSGLSDVATYLFGGAGVVNELFATGTSPGGGYASRGAVGATGHNLTASAGDYWQVTGSGTHNVDAQSSWNLNDWVIYSGSAGAASTWKKLAFEDTIASIVIGDLSSSSFHMGSANDKQVIFAKSNAHSGSSRFTFDYDTGALLVSGSGVTLTGPEAGDAVLTMKADQGDDAADVTTLTVAAAGGTTLATGGGSDIIINSGGGSVRPLTDSATGFGHASYQWSTVYTDTLDLGGQGNILIRGTGTQGIYLDADGDTILYVSADDVVNLKVGGNIVNTITPTSMQVTGTLEVSGSGVIITGGEAENAVLTFKADQGDDSADISSIYHAVGIFISSSSNITFDSHNGNIYFKDAGYTRGQFLFDSDGWKFRDRLNNEAFRIYDNGVSTAPGIRVSDDTKIEFGDSAESYIQYREALDNYLVISGSAAGLVLSGSNIVMDGAFSLAATTLSGHLSGTTSYMSGDSWVFGDLGVTGSVNAGSLSGSSTLNVVGASTFGPASYASISAAGVISGSGDSTIHKVTMNQLVAGTADINGGSVDGATLGAASPSSVKATTISGSGAMNVVGASTFGPASYASISAAGVISGSGDSSIHKVTMNQLVAGTADINGGSVDGATIGAASQSSVKATTLSGSGAMNVAGASTFGPANYASISAAGIISGSGDSTIHKITMNQLVAATADINGGSVDAATIGAASQSSVKATTLSGSSTLNVAGASTFGPASYASISAAGVISGSGDSTIHKITMNQLVAVAASAGVITGSGDSTIHKITMNQLVAGTADINGGSVDGATIGAASQSSVKATTISGSGAMNIVGASTFGPASYVSISAAGVISGSGDSTIHKVTMNQLVAGTADINGGSVDGATVGAASQSSVKATTLSGSGAMNVVGASTFGPASYASISAAGVISGSGDSTIHKVTMNQLVAGTVSLGVTEALAGDTGSNQVLATTGLSLIMSDGDGSAYSLADGAVSGQIKEISMVQDGGGDATVTVATAGWGGSSTIVFDGDDDYARIVWMNAGAGAKWYPVYVTAVLG